MKKSNLFLKLIFILSALLITMTYCKKDEEEEDTTEQESIDANLVQAVVDEAVASSLFDDANDQAEDAHSDEDNTKKSTYSDCIGTTITLETPDTGYSRRITIDFGTSGIYCKGRTRKGKIFVDVSGNFLDSGTVRRVTFENYIVDGYQIKGERLVTNQGTDANGYLTYDVSVKGTIIVQSNNDSITWTANRTRKRVAGGSTPWYVWDDQYEISGGSSGVTRTGATFTKTIITPLLIDIAGNSCSDISRTFVKEGIIDIDVEGNPTVTVDYGTGCDTKVTITVNEYSIESTL